MTTVYSVLAEIAMANNAGENTEKAIVHSEDLFQGKREVIIKHADNHYRLLITKSGKLILNK